MKPFDLEAAKRGEPIVMRDGRKVKFVAYVPEASPDSKIIVVSDIGNVLIYREDGRVCPYREYDSDLVMTPPPMRSINGYEYPEPVREPLKDGQRYFIASPLSPKFFNSFVWGDYDLDLAWLKRGMIHLTSEAAVAHTRAIILGGGGKI